MESWILLFLLGFNFTLWAAVGAARLVSEACLARAPREPDRDGERSLLSRTDVAVLIPARNEEAGIAATIASVMRQVPAENIHVIADGCTDRTAEVAHGYGVNVLVLTPSRGKAGGIEAAVRHFDFAERFKVLLILDADTQLDEHYVTRGLPLLDDPGVGAVAGYVYSNWQPRELSMVGRLLVSYRTRVWAVMQAMKYGQTWRYTDVTPIVPGFASMYRTEILPNMEINPPGLVIEDFNMTFELRRKKLGRVAFRSGVFGTAQDPGNYPDYYRQITRWSLGFWQTVRRHGLWYSGFTVALVPFVAEALLAAVVTILTSLALVLVALVPLTGGAVLRWGWYGDLFSPLRDVLTPTNLLLFVLVPDYLLTIVVAVWLRRPSLLVYGIAFPLLRVIDSTATLRGLWQLRFARSTGKWTSPERRPVEAPAILQARVGGGDAQPDGDAFPAAPSTPAEVEEGAPASARRWRPRTDWAHARPVLRDALLASAVVAAGWVLFLGGVPLMVTLAAVIVCLPVAATWSHSNWAKTRASR